MSQKDARDYIRVEGRGSEDDKQAAVDFIASERAHQDRHPLRCARMDSDRDGMYPWVKPTLAYAHEDGTADATVVLVSPDFGCVMHTPKP